MKKARLGLLILLTFLYIVVAKTQCMETNIEEIWKDVVGYEGLYQVSSLGRIKTVRNNKIRISISNWAGGFKWELA